MKRIKAILDFDGTLTDEMEQAGELAVLAKKMLAEEVLEIPLEEVDRLYDEIKDEILNKPHKYHWMVNRLPATYAYEGAYLLNTSVLQNVMRMKPQYLKIIRKKFPAGGLDSVTRCSNYLFHTNTLKISPHFLAGTREFLVELLEHEAIDPVILSNSETRKIGKNLEKLGIGEKGTKHKHDYEIFILGDTRQYHMDGNWDFNFEHEKLGKIQVLPINRKYAVDLRRPVYYQALKKVLEEGYDEVVVVADGFSLAGAVPLMMGMRFILKKTQHTPMWSEKFVSSHPKGDVVATLGELKLKLLSLIS